MKKLSILFLSAAILLFIGSCTKSTSTVAGGTWTATVNGQKQSGYTSAGYQLTSNTLFVTMTSAAGVSYPNIALTVANNGATVVKGPYTLNTVASATYGLYSTDSSFTYVSNLGQLNLSQINLGATTVSGTYSYTGINLATSDSVVITNGTFSDKALVVF